MKQQLKIEAGKFYRTRDGRKAGIYRTDVNHSGYSIHGYVIELNGGEHLKCWYGDGRYSSTGDSISDLIEEWQEPLDFDWGCLPEWCNGYIAKNEYGAWYAYSNAPTLGHWSFYYEDEVPIRIPGKYQPKNFTGDWTDSLFKNPNLD